MESFLEYKGFLIEPLVYPRAFDADQKRYAPLDLRYHAAVRLTDVNALGSSIVSVLQRSDFACLGDARRAAEVFGRGLVDAPTAVSPDKKVRALAPRRQKPKNLSDAT